jgi:hypothetical protein
MEIANDIRAAVAAQTESDPNIVHMMHYVEALALIPSWDGKYKADSAVTVAAYASTNFQFWRKGGETAKKLKAELNKALAWAQKQGH